MSGKGPGDMRYNVWLLQKKHSAESINDEARAALNELSETFKVSEKEE